ncbi:MAG: hypothetical protein EA421_09375 [Gemmatimonadales bacterium]|nr:MAG: hypothetical protein EA421_09375 [Gemmatimonadales bacterium]
MLALDGVFSGDAERGVRFHEATGLEARGAAALARTVQLRVLRWFARRGLLDPTTAADMQTWRGTDGFASHLRCSGSSTAVDGSVRIAGEDASPPAPPPGPWHQAASNRPSEHPSSPDSHGASSTSASAAFRRLPGL